MRLSSGRLTRTVCRASRVRPQVLQEQMRVVDLHLGRDPTRQPVLHTLGTHWLTAGNLSGDLGRATKTADQLGIGVIFSTHERRLHTMFIHSSNTPCNNTVFGVLTIESMDEIHPSMARLYRAAKIAKDANGQAQLAKGMNESSQTINNWEARGISERGALKAQKLYHCDANWLIEGDVSFFPTAATGPVTALQANEPALPFGWPFKTIRPHQWELLQQDEVAHIESGIALLVKAREDPEKHATPARNGTQH